jgi:hypothetical protein
MVEEIRDTTSGANRETAPSALETAPKPGTKAALERAKKRREEEGRKPEVRKKRSRK